MIQKDAKWVLITGGAKGIGKSISKRLSKSGYHLMLVGRDDKALKAQAEEILKESQVQVETFPFDLSALGTARDLFGALCQRGLPIPQAIVCNAADYGTLGNLSEVNFGDWKKSFDLNFFSVAELIQQYVKKCEQFPTAKRRKILVMAGGGLGSAQVWPGISAYACAKAAVNRLAEVLHEELHMKGYDINCIAPGFVKTGITDQVNRAGKEVIGALYDANKKVVEQGGDSPELAAELVETLLSERCDGLSGRLLSAKWDRKTLEKPEVISQDKDMFRLRRIDNELFAKKAT